MSKGSAWRFSHYLLVFVFLIPVCLICSLMACTILLGMGGIIGRLLLLGTTTSPQAISAYGVASGIAATFVCLSTCIGIFTLGWKMFAAYVNADLKGAGRENALRREAQEAMLQFERDDNQE